MGSATRRIQIDQLNEQAYQLLGQDAARARQLSQQAYHLTDQLDTEGQPYPHGKAASLRTLSKLDILVDNQMAQGIQRCYEGLAMLESEPDPKIHAALLRYLGYAHFYLGDLPEAFDLTLKALDIATDAQDLEGETDALLNLSLYYGSSEDRQQEIEMLEVAHKRYYQLGDQDGQATVLNNLALVLAEVGRFEEAHHYGVKSLQIARQSNLKVLECFVLDTLGQVAIQAGGYKQAQAHFTAAWQAACDSGVTQVALTAQINQAKTMLMLGQVAQAVAALRHGLQEAEQVGAHDDLCECHKLLAEAYQRLEKPAEALRHFQKYHELSMSNLNQGAAQRMQAMKVLHQLDAAKREAEIYRKQNAALQQEVERRQQVQSALEELAATDPLTGLLNRRRFFELAEIEFLHAQNSNIPLAMIIIDIDKFKQYNDIYGHLVGDKALTALAQAIRHNLRQTDIPCRYGGDEFVILLPETAPSVAAEIAIRLETRLSNIKLQDQSNKVALNVSLGCAGILPDDQRVEDLLRRADQDMYHKKANKSGTPGV